MDDESRAAVATLARKGYFERELYEAVGSYLGDAGAASGTRSPVAIQPERAVESALKHLIRTRGARYEYLDFKRSGRNTVVRFREGEAVTSGITGPPDIEWKGTVLVTVDPKGVVVAVKSQR